MTENAENCPLTFRFYENACHEKAMHIAFSEKYLTYNHLEQFLKSLGLMADWKPKAPISNQAEAFGGHSGRKKALKETELKTLCEVQHLW